MQLKVLRQVIEIKKVLVDRKSLSTKTHPMNHNENQPQMSSNVSNAF